MYFHAIIRWRRLKNKISGVHSLGNWIEEPLMVKDEVQFFYINRGKVGQ